MKTMYLIGACALAMFAASCNEKPAETKTIIITEKPADPPKTVVVEVEKEKKGTSVKIGPDGGSVKTKDVDIEVNK